MTTTSYKPEWIREDFIDFIAEKFDAIWAYKRVKAQLVKSRCVGIGFYELSFLANHNFKAANLSTRPMCSGDSCKGWCTSST
jgi:hypothetical protein